MPLRPGPIGGVCRVLEYRMLNPSANRRRVVITGMDALSCLGDSLDEISQSLRSGRSRIVINKERQELGFRSALTGAIKPVDAAAHFSRKVLKSMGETALRRHHGNQGCRHGGLCRTLEERPRWFVNWQ